MRMPASVGAVSPAPASVRSSTNPLFLFLGAAAIAGFVYIAKTASEREEEEADELGELERGPIETSGYEVPTSLPPMTHRVPHWARDVQTWTLAEHRAGPGAPDVVVASIYQSLGGRVAA